MEGRINNLNSILLIFQFCEFQGLRKIDYTHKEWKEAMYQI